MTSRVILVRHGQSEGNVARIWTSAREGYPLTALGQEQAAGVADRLRDKGIRAAYSSGILRAKQTAAIIAEGLGLSAPQEVEGLEELNVGVFEGQHDDVVGPAAASIFRSWLHDGDLQTRFEGGESADQIAARSRAAVESLARRHDGETILAVAHGGVLSVLLSTQCPPIREGFAAGHHMVNGAIAVVDVDPGTGTWTAVEWDAAGGAWF